MSCPHFYKDVCKGTNKSVSRTVRDNTCLTSSYGDCAYYKQASASGCFITSAVCVSQGKPDDCYELNLFRSFRDGWLSRQEGGMDAIAEYYACAPYIVSAVDRQPDAEKVWAGVYEKYIAPCVSLMEAGDSYGAFSLYSTMVGDLKARYV